MAHDSVVWAVGNGAAHSPEVARQMAYAAVGGYEGVLGPADCKVTAQTSPNGTVQMARGAYSILNRFTTGNQEAYIGRAATVENVAIAPTAASGRSDAIIIEIIDPFAAGSPHNPPSNPVVGPYVRTRVVSGVSPTLTEISKHSGFASLSAYMVARVDIPANTTAITNAMIKDVRKLNDPRSEISSKSFISTQPGKDGSGYLTPNPIPGSFARWPSGAGYNVDIPIWATKMSVLVLVQGAATRVAGSYGEVKAKIGTVETPVTEYDYDWVGSPERVYVGATADLVIPSAMRGTTVTAEVLARRLGGGVNGHITAMKGTSTLIQIVFFSGVE